MIPETPAVATTRSSSCTTISTTSTRRPARIDDRTRVLKHSDTFAVFDRFGEIDAFNRSQFGVFHEDTRFLSRLRCA